MQKRADPARISLLSDKALHEIETLRGCAVQALEVEATPLAEILKNPKISPTPLAPQVEGKFFNPLLASLKANHEDTYWHGLRVGHYVEKMLTTNPDLLNKTNVPAGSIVLAAQLHDIGKRHLPAEILDHAGEYRSRLRQAMRFHTVLGVQDILHIGRQSSWREHLAQVALFHHENLDGSGYYGLRGEEILMAVRLCSVADTFDALTSARGYKPAMSIEQTFDEMCINRHEHFDKQVVGTLLEVLEAEPELVSATQRMLNRGQKVSQMTNPENLPVSEREWL